MKSNKYIRDFSKMDFNVYLFWLHFDKQLIWIIPLMLISLVLNGGIILILILGAFMIKGLKMQADAENYRNWKRNLYGFKDCERDFRIKGGK